MSQEAVLPDAGSRDLAAAAAALRSRLPEPLAALAAIAYNYRWSWTPGGPELFASIDARALGAVRRQPGPAAAGGPPGRAGASSPRTRRFLERVAALEEAVSAEGARRRSPPPA